MIVIKQLNKHKVFYSSIYTNNFFFKSVVVLRAKQMNDKPWIAVNVKSGYKRDKFSKYIFLQQIKPWKMVDFVMNPFGPAVGLLLVYIVCFWNRTWSYNARLLWKTWLISRFLSGNCDRLRRISVIRITVWTLPNIKSRPFRHGHPIIYDSCKWKN